MKKQKFFWGVLLFIVLCLGLSRINWLALMEGALFHADSPAVSDLIIVPSGASVKERIDYAAYLYKKGFAPKVLLSGHMSLGKETGIDLMKIYAVKMGISEDAIVREPDSVTTWENAVFSRKAVEGKGYRKILIVTSPHHARRAQMLFRKVFPKSIQVNTVSPPLSEMKQPWYSNDERVRAAAHEFLSFFWLYLTAKSSGSGDWE